MRTAAGTGGPRPGGSGPPARDAYAPQRRRAPRRRTLKTFLGYTFLLIESAIAVVVLGGLFVFWRFTRDDLAQIQAISGDMSGPVSTTVWSQDGVLLCRLDAENRRPVPLDQISRNVINATIAVEDHRFYEHHGVDPVGIVRAAWADVRGKTASEQGASTLTQQLVRNLHQFGISRNRTISRKLREMLTAIRVEQLYSKDEILRLYLNNIYYGAGAYGIEAAAETYFGKHASHLDIAQAAMLAGLPQRPSADSPFGHMDAALRRRAEVLDRMVQCRYITSAQYDSASREQPALVARPPSRTFHAKAPYFVTYVLQQLDRRYGPEFVQHGLRIVTTLNYKIQVAAERALADGLDRDRGYGTNQGALICLDPHTGYIRAMVGGRSFRRSQYNAAVQGTRQPGSAFKLFDYSAAFDTDTLNLRSSFVDRPIPYAHDPLHRWVKNYEGRCSYRRLDLLDAIKYSKNTIAVQAAQAVGIKTVIVYAQRMGISTPLAPYLPTALGASAVHPIDLCSAYSIIPNNGSRYKPMAVVSVTDSDGNSVEQDSPQLDPDVLKPDTVDQMNQAFEAVVNGGTGTAARGNSANGIVDDAHGKTGTTSDSRDAWFAGYTPELTAVVWVASVHHVHGGQEYAPMHGGTGGVLCAPIWHDFMISAVPEQRKFSAPQTASAAAPPEQTSERPEDRHAQSRASQAATSVPTGAPPAGDASSVQPGLPAPAVGAPVPDGNSANTPDAAASPDTGEVPLETSSSPPTPPPRVVAPAPQYVNVTVCVDSGQRATRWCPVTETVRMTVRRARRLGVCRLHHPPPGEG